MSGAVGIITNAALNQVVITAMGINGPEEQVKAVEQLQEYLEWYQCLMAKATESNRAQLAFTLKSVEIAIDFVHNFNQQAKEKGYSREYIRSLVANSIKMTHA